MLDVEFVLAPGETVDDALAGTLADAAAAVFKGPPHSTWVKLRALPAGRYAENAGGPPAGVYPVFVSVLVHTIPQGNAQIEQVAAITNAVAVACSRSPENVHVLYMPAAAGRMAFGGQLVPATKSDS
jgi:hypothetical protein